MENLRTNTFHFCISEFYSWPASTAASLTVLFMTIQFLSTEVPRWCRRRFQAKLLCLLAALEMCPVAYDTDADGNRIINLKPLLAGKNGTIVNIQTAMRSLHSPKSPITYTTRSRALKQILISILKEIDSTLTNTDIELKLGEAFRFVKQWELSLEASSSSISCFLDFTLRWKRVYTSLLQFVNTQEAGAFSVISGDDDAALTNIAQHLGDTTDLSKFAVVCTLAGLEGLTVGERTWPPVGGIINHNGHVNCELTCAETHSLCPFPLWDCAAMCPLVFTMKIKESMDHLYFGHTSPEEPKLVSAALLNGITYHVTGLATPLHSLLEAAPTKHSPIELVKSMVNIDDILLRDIREPSTEINYDNGESLLITLPNDYTLKHINPLKSPCTSKGLPYAKSHPYFAARTALFLWDGGKRERESWLSEHVLTVDHVKETCSSIALKVAFGTVKPNSNVSYHKCAEFLRISDESAKKLIQRPLIISKKQDLNHSISSRHTIDSGKNQSAKVIPKSINYHHKRPHQQPGQTPNDEKSL
eukprot:Tbor_TRINITY_DN4867_c0_g1::TRINITY_DN4867_c0_g1_i1::g.1204::m.1204